MALIPLNTFKTKTKSITNFSATTSTITAYTAPIGVTSIVLMAQVSNLTTQTQSIDLMHWRNRPVLADAQGNGAQPGNTGTYLVRNFAIPPGDAANLLAGKLIIESLDSVRIWATNSGTCQLTLSILETANN